MSLPTRSAPVAALVVIGSLGFTALPLVLLACSPAANGPGPQLGSAPSAASSTATASSASASSAAIAASASAPRPPSKECLAAKAQRARVPGLLDEGRLDRAARVLARGIESCPEDAREAWGALAGVLVELDRFEEAAALIAKIEAAKDASAETKAAALAAKDRLAKLDAKPTDASAAKELAAARVVEAQEAQGRGDHKAARTKWLAAWEAQHPNGDALWQAGLAAKETAEPAAAQRLFDRAIVDLERENAGKLSLDVENGLALPPTDVAWIDGGKTLVIAEGDDLLVIDALTWIPRMKIDALGANIYAIAVAADGKTAACALDDGNVPIVDLARGVVLRTIAAHGEPVNGVAISADGKLVATASSDSTISILDAQKGAKLRVLKGHGDAVGQVAFSPDGARVASGSNDGTVRTWDVASGKELKVVKGHADGVTALAWSPDGKILVSGAGDGVVRVLSGSSLKVEKVLKGQTLGVSLSFSADGKRLASTSLDESARVYEVGTWKAKQKLAVHGATSAAFAPDGRSLAVVAGPDAVEVWGLPKWALTRSIKRHAEAISSMALDGSASATSAAPSIAFASLDGSVRLWKLGGDAAPETLVKSADPMRAVAWSRDGKVLATGGDHGALRLWNADKRTAIGSIKGFDAGVREIALTANGARVAWTSGTVDRFLAVGDRGKPNAMIGLYGHKGMVDAVDWAPDASMIASGADDTWLILWDPIKGEKKAVFKGHKKGITALAWSPDGATIATGSADATIRLWDPTAAPEKAEKRTLSGHTRDVKAIAWSPNGKRLVSGGYDKSVIVWDVAAGTSRALEESADWITAVGFTRDGQRIVTAGRDGTLRVFDASDGRLRVSLRAISGGVSGASAGYAFTPEGLFEPFPKTGEARRFAQCRVGPRLFPLTLCAERYVLDGLVAKAATGDASYLEP
jgi:WD40 repeat protein